MLDRLERTVGTICARVADGAQRLPLLTMVLALAAGVASCVYVARHLAIDADPAAMFSRDLPFRRTVTAFDRAFPILDETFVIVIDADIPDLAYDRASALAERIRADTDHFTDTYHPGGGAYFEHEGLLYLDEPELQDLADRLARIEPLVADLEQNPSVTGFLGLLRRVTTHSEDYDFAGNELNDVLGRVSESITAAANGRYHPLSWQLMMRGGAKKSTYRQIVITKPRLVADTFQPAADAMAALRSHFGEVGLNGADQPTARVTGDLALSYEEMEIARDQAITASLWSLAIVVLILWWTLRSLWFVIAVVVTLVLGLSWTTAFAALAIGHLNLLSVTFGVMFIGLGVDFGIHVGVRYCELFRRGLSRRAALDETMLSVGASLWLCAVTTAIGFYSFELTSYAGVAELGLICGTGMFASLVASVTVLPALITMLPSSVGRRRAVSRFRGSSISGALARHPRITCGVAAALGLAAASLLPRVRFDANPLDMRDPHAESVIAFRDVAADDAASLWSLNVIVPDLGASANLRHRLEALGTVEQTLTIADYVPENQARKLAILADIDTFLPPPASAVVPDSSPAAVIKSLESLDASLKDLLSSDRRPTWIDGARALHEAVTSALASLRTPDRASAVSSELQHNLLDTLPQRMHMLRTALDATPVTLASLPDEIRDRMVTSDGRYRIEIDPRGNVSHDAALERFVDSVRTVAPDATGTAVMVVESKRAVIRALTRALSTAAVAITLFLSLLWRRPGDVARVMASLALAALLTAAASVVFDIPFNFADVIVLPLLLGIGVDSGIHLVHRYRALHTPPAELLSTSTARGVLASALTTVASFGTLAFTTHRGMASLGRLLTVGVVLTMLCNLLVVPALLALGRGESERR